MFVSVQALFKSSTDKTSRSIFYVFLLFSSLLLSACGGGGGGSAAPVADPNDPASAIVLTYPANLPHNDSITLVDENSSLYKSYKITGLTPGQEYELGLGINDSATMSVYELPDFTSSVTGCNSVNSCNVLPDSNGNVYLKVYYFSYTTLTASYTMSMAVLPAFEGSTGSPVVLDSTASLPYITTSTVNLNGYYQITGLTAGNSYTMSVANAADASASLYVYQDQFSSLACSSLGSSYSKGVGEACTFTAAGSSIWVRVKSVVAGDFTLSISDNGLPSVYNYSAEGGIGTEVELTLDLYSLNRETDYLASYYHIAGLTPGETYRAFVDNIYGGNVDLYVYTDSAYSNLGCSSANLELTIEKCLAIAPASGELWIKVDGSQAHQYLGASYSMGVYQYYPNEGTSSDSLQLTYSGSNPLHSSTVDSISYYHVNGLVAGQSYVVDVTNIVGNLERFAVNGANPVGFFTADCDLNYILYETSASCIVEAKADGSLSIIVEEDYDFSGTSFDLSVSLSPHQSEGTEDVPVSLALGSAQLPHSGAVGGAPSYYAITGLTADQAYTITMDGTPSHSLWVYTSSFVTASGAACIKSYPDSGSISQCTVRTLSDTLWVKVGDTNLGGTFTLDAIHAPYQSEGSQATPVQIPLGADAVQGVSRESMVSIDSSYYQVTGLTIGEIYAIAARNIDSSYNHRMFIYDNAGTFGSTVYGDYACSRLNLRSGNDEYCTITAIGTSLWVMIDGNTEAAGARYDLSARLQPITEALVLDDSVPATFPRTASVGAATNSIYTITGLVANELYDITLSNMTDDVDISFCSTNTGLTDELCIKQANASGELTVTVTGSKSLYGAFYTLGISAGNVNEGTDVAPLSLDSALAFPYSGQVGTDESFYKVTGLLVDTLYEVSLSNLTAEVDLYVYTSSTLSITSCKDTIGTTNNKLCGAASTPAGELYISVRAGFNVLGANFTLNVVQGLGHEGGQLTEVPLAYASADLPHAGTVDKTKSYYQITGLDGATDYLIAVNNPTDSVSLYVYEDNNYSFYMCNSATSGIAAACLATTKNGGAAGAASLFVEVSGISTLIGAEYTIDVLAATVNEGSLSTPVVLDYAVVSSTPYAGQVAASTGSDSYSYYRLDNLIAANSYTLSMQTQQSRANLYVYTSAADLVSGTSACNVPTSNVGDPQVCSVTSVGASLWIKIGYTNFSTEGTYFTLSATTP